MGLMLYMSTGNMCIHALPNTDFIKLILHCEKAVYFFGEEYTLTYSVPYKQSTLQLTAQ